MALRNQPYLPLYVQDFLTDEKLNECSPEATGVYIKIMCIMHKSDPYGKILLKQKDKQTNKQINNFALKLVKHLPWATPVIQKAIEELIEEDVLQLEGDSLCQKRMIKDNNISLKRSKAGKSGVEKKKKKEGFASAKPQANSEIEVVIENTIVNNSEEILIEKIRAFHNKKIHSQDHKYIMRMVLGCRDKNIGELWEEYKNYKASSGERVHTDLTVLFGSPDFDYKDGVIHNNDYQLKSKVRFQLPTPQQIRQLNGQEYQQLIKDAKADGWDHVEGQNRHFKKGDTKISY